MKKKFWMAFVLVGLAGCGQKEQGIELIPKGQRVPAVEIGAQFLNSSDLSLEKMRGKVVVLDFWATWCGPCKREIPTLIKMCTDYHPKGLEVIGLSIEGDDKKPMEYFGNFISENNINYPIGLCTMDTERNYGISPIPTTFFIDKTGRIALSFVGVHSEEDFTKSVEKLLAE